MMLGFLLAIILGTGAGFIIGGTVASTLIGFTVGSVTGMGWMAIWYGWLYEPSPERVIADRAELSLVCIHFGAECTCVLRGDPTAQRWTAVERCSLQPQAPPACEQTCLKMMNNTATRPALAVSFLV